jgi:hypothetical protein
MRAMDATSRTVALIEALHPDGAVDEVHVDGASSTVAPSLVIGSGPPAALAEDGIAWVAVPPGRRGRMRAELRRRGLLVGSSWLPVPRSAPRVLLPVVPASGATRRRLAVGLPGGRLVRLALGCTDRLLEELAPGIGLLAQRPGARPALAWLSESGAQGPVVVSSSWHEPAAGLVCSGERTVVKSSRSGAERDPRREAAALRELGPAARRAGARVPRVLYDGPAGRRTALVEDTLAGVRAAMILRRQPSRLDALVTQVGDWLARWHVETRVTRPFGAEDLERFILSPARALAPRLPHGAAYLERLDRLGRSLYGSHVPFATAHNDLTTWNLLVDRDALAVVDWEAAEREALPLVDLDYLLIDAVAAARRTRQDLVFRRCAAGGRDGRLVNRLHGELRSRLGLDHEVAELARHACWLGHARNEDQRAAPGTPRPFLAIVALLAEP